MKKLSLVVLVLTLGSSVVFGQIAYKAGDKNVGGMIGLGGYGGVYGESTLPSLAASYELGFNENISIGGVAGFTSSSYTISGNWQYKYTYILVGARGAYHYDLLHKDNIDTYGGILIGYNIVSFSEENRPASWPYPVSASSSYLTYGGFVGGRYYFNENLGVQAELGYGIGLLTVGVTYKL